MNQSGPQLTIDDGTDGGVGSFGLNRSELLAGLVLVDARQAAAAILGDWLGVVGAAVIVETAWHPLAYALAVVWIGSRQHSLFLLAHEGVHGLLHRDRRWNDVWAKLFCAWPVLVPFDSYRHIHLLHHRHLNSPADPDWARNRPDRLDSLRHSPLGLWRMLLGLERSQLALLDFFVVGERLGDGSPTQREAMLRFLFYLTITALVVLSGSWAVVFKYWLVPLATWFLITMRLKGMAEHMGVPGDALPNAARSTIPSRFDGLLIAPRNIGYHAAHHLSPGVPWHGLPDLHSRLMQDPALRRRMHVTHGYSGFLGELLAREPRRPTAG